MVDSTIGRALCSDIPSLVPLRQGFADSIWIVNSRNTADEDAVRALAELAGFTPRIGHPIGHIAV